MVDVAGRDLCYGNAPEHGAVPRCPGFPAIAETSDLRGADLEGDTLQRLADGRVGGDTAGRDQRARRAVALAENLQTDAQAMVMILARVS